MTSKQLHNRQLETGRRVRKPGEKEQCVCVDNNCVNFSLFVARAKQLSVRVLLKIVIGGKLALLARLLAFRLLLVLLINNNKRISIRYLI